MGIHEYAQSCLSKVKRLKSMFAQIQHVELDIVDKIKSLTHNNLFEFKKITREEDKCLPCKDFFTEIETLRTEKICQMVKVYETLGPILLKLESLVTNSNTGRAPYMESYYAHWEKKVYAALVKLMSLNLIEFNNLFLRKEKLFQVDAMLVLPEILLRPSPTDTFNIVMRNIRDFLGRLRSFRRWMDRTCLLCEPQNVPNSDDFYSFSFYEDVVQVQEIHDIMNKIQDSVHENLLAVHKYVQRWKRYRNIWTFDKPSTVQRFLQHTSVLVKYDEKLTFYGNIIKDMQERIDFVDIGSIRLNLRPLFDAIIEHATQWRDTLGQYVANLTKNKMVAFKETMDELRSIVNKNIKGLDLFKAIMQAITTILRMNVSAELEYLNYQETYRMLRQHMIQFDPADEEMAYELQKEWKSLYFSALYRGSWNF